MAPEALPQPVPSLTGPTSIPSSRAALGTPIRQRSPIQQVPHQPGRHAPQVPVPQGGEGGLAHGCRSSSSSRLSLPSPFLSASGPSPARRVPQLHRLHGAASSRPDPLTAPSSPQDLPEPAPQALPHFRFPPTPEAARGAGRGRGREDGLRHVVRRGRGPRSVQGSSSERPKPAGAAPKDVLSLRRCLLKTVGPQARNPSLPQPRPLVSQTEVPRPPAKRRLAKSCGFLTSQVSGKRCSRDCWRFGDFLAFSPGCILPDGGWTLQTQSLHATGPQPANCPTSPLSTASPLSHFADIKIANVY